MAQIHWPMDARGSAKPLAGWPAASTILRASSAVMWLGNWARSECASPAPFPQNRPTVFLSQKRVPMTSFGGGWCQELPPGFQVPPPVTVLILDLALNLFPFWAAWEKVAAVREGVVTSGPSGLGQDGGCGYGIMQGSREDRIT